MEEYQEVKQVNPGDKFLTLQEQVVCKQISENTSPYSQQALTLLALHAGDTQQQASEKSGLTPGQVKYLAAKFRRQRLHIFPRQLLRKLNFSIEEHQNDLSTDTAKLTKADKKISGTYKGKSQKDKD